MAEYIERDMFLKIISHKPSIPITDREDRLIDGFISAVKNCPAADVRPVVRAEWYGEADGYADGELVYDMWSCPICGKRFEEWEEKPDWNFCPNCGADMREGN